MNSWRKARGWGRGEGIYDESRIYGPEQLLGHVAEDVQVKRENLIKRVV